MSIERPAVDEFVINSIRKAINRESYEIADHPSYLGIGIDSVVLRYGDKVIKFYIGTPGYKAKLSFDDLLLYQQTTNRAVQLLNEKPIPLGLSAFENTTLRINPLEKIYLHEDLGCFVSVSPYISGKNINQLDLSVDGDEVVRSFSSMNNYFNSSLSVVGIQLTPMNIKLNTQKELVITDLCSSISDLKVADHF
jgi:hypothetical protein